MLPPPPQPASAPAGSRTSNPYFMIVMNMPNPNRPIVTLIAMSRMPDMRACSTQLAVLDRTPKLQHEWRTSQQK